MSDAGNTCVALMVSAAMAGSEHTKPRPAAMRCLAFIPPPPVVLGARGILPSCPVTTVFMAFEQTARAHGAKPFLQVLPDEVELTYSQALSSIHEIAGAYSKAGYGKGHRVALRLPN